MFRRIALSTAFPLRGGPRPWKKRNMPIAIHQSQRPPQSTEFEASKLTYPVTHNVSPTIERTLWSEKPVSAPNLPFAVDRTTVGNQLPVYTDLVSGGTRVVTMVRKIRGDAMAMKKDMEIVCEREVLVKPGKLVVVGNYSGRLRKWLTGLGF